MNKWSNAVITENGLALLSKLTQGNTLNITRAVTGSGFVTPGLLVKQTEVTDPQQTLNFRTISYPENGKCALTVTLSNDELDVGYDATQVGIYATDPDNGEILFFISQSTDAQKGTEVPSKTEMPGYAAEWTFYFAYGQADTVNVSVDPANAVSQAAMESYFEENLPKSLPANGGNADTVGGKKADEFAPAVHSHNYAGSSSSGGAATSAEKLNKEVTIQIDLGSTSSADFNGSKNVTPGVSGILPIEHGGLGVNTVEAAQSKLGIITMNENPNLHIWAKYNKDPNSFSLASVTTFSMGIANSGFERGFYYSDEIEISSKEIYLKDPVYISGNSPEKFDGVANGKFVSNSISGKTIVYYIQPDSTPIQGDGDQILLSNAQSVSANSKTAIEYVAYKAKGMYPDSGAKNDGFWYEYLGKLGAGLEKPFTYGKTDLEAGVSPLKTGALYFVYE